MIVGDYHQAGNKSMIQEHPWLEGGTRDFCLLPLRVLGKCAKIIKVLFSQNTNLCIEAKRLNDKKNQAEAELCKAYSNQESSV